MWTTWIITVSALAGSTEPERAVIAPTVITDAQPATRGSVSVVVRGEASAVARVRDDVMGGAIDGVTIEVTASDAIDLAAIVGPGPGDDGVLASIWVDLAASGTTATIVVVDGPRERVLVRHIPAPQGPDVAVLEAVTTIIASSIEALHAGGRIGIARDDAAASLAQTADTRRPAPAPDAEIRESPTPRNAGRGFAVGETVRVRPRMQRPMLLVEGGWRVGAWASSPVVNHGPAIALDLASRHPIRPGGGISGGYRLPVAVDANGVDVRVDTGSLRAWGGVAPRVRPRLSLRARLGGGVDLLRVAPRSDAATAAGISVRAIPIVTPLVGLWWTLPRDLGLAVDAGLDVDLVDTRLVLRGPTRVVFDPWRARPWLAISLTWEALGGRP